MTDRREASARSPGAANGATPPDPAADRERVLLLECRLEQMRSALDAAREEADRARTKLAEAAAREADHARRYSLIHQELAEARAEVGFLHRHLEHSEALRAEIAGHLFEAADRRDADELVRLRQKVLADDQRALVSDRTVARLRERIEELTSSRETLLMRIAEWQQLIREDGPEAADLSEFLAELRRDILDLEHRNVTGEAREAELRERLAMAGIDPDQRVQPRSAAGSASPASRPWVRDGDGEEPERAEEAAGAFEPEAAAASDEPEVSPAADEAEALAPSDESEGVAASEEPEAVAAWDEPDRRTASEEPEAVDVSDESEARVPSEDPDVREARIASAEPEEGVAVGEPEGETPADAAAEAPEPPAPARARPAGGRTAVLAEELLAADVPAVQADLLLRLGRSGESDAVEVVEPWTESSEPSVRSAAYEALGRLLERDPEALEPYLRAGLADADARVRRRVALAAATARGLSPADLLEPLREDPDPQVRRVVREVLRRTPRGDSSPRTRSAGSRRREPETSLPLAAPEGAPAAASPRAAAGPSTPRRSRRS